MESKKGPFSSLINDAISSMDIDTDQKPINVKTSSEDSFNEKLINANKSFLSKDEFNEGNKPSENFNNQNSEDYIKWFSELSNKDVETVGGKGASLGEMFNFKFPVPPGFVVTAQAFDYFVTKSGVKEKMKEIINNLNVEDTEELIKASKKIRGMIENQKMPNELKSEIVEAYSILSSKKIDEKGISIDALNILKNSQEPIFVSVRSSATTEDLADASFAGQQESFLNIKGKDRLIEYIKKCFSSLYTPRAIYYRNRKGFSEEKALLAVVVQKMIDSEKSGVVFSRNPIKQNNEIVLEAVFGLGEGIVSGKIKPDHYIISRDLEIKDIKIVNKKIAIVRTGSGDNEIVRLSDEKSKSQVLSRGEIKEVADFAIKLEEHYRKPQDIEFAIERGEVYIIQSRPITTLGEKRTEVELKGNMILQGQSASPGIKNGVVKIVKSMDDLVKIKKGDVLVTEMTNPDMVVAMQKSVAIVTDEGGMTSHAAIVSREMGIPCIVGTETATQELKDGMRITVDGSSGKVFEGGITESKTVEIKEAVETDIIKLKVIVDLPDFAERAAESGIDYVGLTRLEGIIATMKKHPLQYEKEDKLDEYSKVIEEGLSKIMEYFKGVWFRASDVRTDEYSSLKGSPEKEINPMLGFHGIRFSLKHPEILKAELEAMKRIAQKNPDKKIGIMFPQVISIEEVKEAKKYFNEFKFRRVDGSNIDNMEFGVMIETPAAVQIIKDICEEVDFISFGTNDLTQYTLAVDRNNEDVQYLYNEMHPAIFSQIEKVINACNKTGVETSICGQAGSKKEIVEFLFKKGIKSISVNADAAYDISKLIKELERKYIIEQEEISRKEETERLNKEQKKEKERQKEKELKEKRIEEEMRNELIEKRVSEEREKLKELFKNEKQDILDRIAKEKQDFDNEKEKLLMKIEKEKKKYEEKKEDVEVVKKIEDRINKVENKIVKSDDSKQGKEKRNKMSQKKYERYKKWKEKRKQRRMEGKKNRKNEIQGWDKKAELGVSASDNKKNFLDKDNIKIGVVKKGVDIEDFQETPSLIEPLDDINRIEEKAEDIQKDVKEENQETVEEMERSEDRISNENRISSDDITEEANRDIDNSKREEILNEIEEMNKEKKNKNESEIVSDNDAGSNDGSFEEDAGSNDGSFEEDAGSNDGSFEEIGIYNPDEESSSNEGKQKYNYNFDEEDY